MPKDPAPETAPPVLAIVAEPFDGHARGDAITDADALAAILAGPHARHVTVLSRP